jgi:hypothetical protein
MGEGEAIASGRLAARRRRPGQLGEKFAGIKSQHFGDIEQFDDIDPAASTFDCGDHRLIAAKLGGELGLGKSRTLAMLDQKVDQTVLSCRAKGLGHPPPSTIVLKSTGQLTRFSDNQKIWLDGASL